MLMTLFFRVKEFRRTNIVRDGSGKKKRKRKKKLQGNVSIVTQFCTVCCSKKKKEKIGEKEML